MRAATMVIASFTLALGLACGGAPAEPEDDALHTWRLSPGPQHPDIELKLVIDDRVAVYVDGQHAGELDIPLIPEERRDSPGFVASDLDIDFDGANDLRIRDEDNSGAYNHAFVFWRYDPSSRTYTRCDVLDGLHNVGTDPASQRLYTTSLGNGVGSSGTETYYRADGGCTFTELGTMSWDVGLTNGRGDAKCTLPGEEEPIWRMQVDGKPDRLCPESD